jgi:hypothetical protein
MESIQRARDLPRMMAGLAAEHGDKTTVMPYRARDATYLKVHRKASSVVAREKGRDRLIGRTKGGMKINVTAICGSQGQPIDLFVTAGQVCDYVNTRAPLRGLPNVIWLLGDRG